MEKQFQPPVKFLRAILRPVLRYCLNRSIKLQELLEICKELLHEEAETLLSKAGQESSVSRIAVVTGLHRKDVSRMKAESDSKSIRSGPKRSGDISARVVGHWQASKKYRNKDGSIKELSCEGNSSEFAELVRTVSRELNPYTVLFELERAQTVLRTGNGVKLVNKTFIIPKINLDEGLSFLETDEEDLICAVEENLFEEKAIPNLHIKTEYDKISEVHAPEIREWLVQQGEKFHEQVRDFLAQYDADTCSTDQLGKDPCQKGKTKYVRVAMGTFSRIDSEDIHSAGPHSGEKDLSLAENKSDSRNSSPKSARKSTKKTGEKLL